MRRITGGPFWYSVALADNRRPPASRQAARREGAPGRGQTGSRCRTTWHGRGEPFAECRELVAGRVDGRPVEAAVRPISRGILARVHHVCVRPRRDLGDGRVDVERLAVLRWRIDRDVWVGRVGYRRRPRARPPSEREVGSPRRASLPHSSSLGTTARRSGSRPPSDGRVLGHAARVGRPTRGHAVRSARVHPAGRPGNRPRRSAGIRLVCRPRADVSGCRWLENFGDLRFGRLTYRSSPFGRRCRGPKRGIDGG